MTTALSWIVGVAFVLLGIAEVMTRPLPGDQVDRTALAWWSASLCGGGVLVLLGSFVIAREGLALAAVFVGCLVGIVASGWTLILPVLALTLVVLRLMGPKAEGPPVTASPPG